MVSSFVVRFNLAIRFLASNSNLDLTGKMWNRSANLGVLLLLISLSLLHNIALKNLYTSLSMFIILSILLRKIALYRYLLLRYLSKIYLDL